MQYITGFGNGIGRLQYRIGQKKKKEKNDSKIYFEAGALKYIFFHYSMNVQNIPRNIK